MSSRCRVPRLIAHVVIAGAVLLAGCDSPTELTEGVVVRGRAPVTASLSQRITFAVSAVNTGTQNVRYELSCSGIGVEIRSGTTPVWQSYYGVQLTCGRTPDLGPGDSVSFSLDWHGRGNRDIPVAPGTYRVRIGLADAREPHLVVSDPQQYTLTLTP